MGYGGLVVVAVGLLLAVTGSTPWVLAAGMAVWLVAAVTSATGFLAARRALAHPPPGFWTMRALLLRASVHGRPTPPRR